MQLNINTNKRTFQQISLAERKLIEKLVKVNKSKSEIANLLGRHRSTISRLLNNSKNTEYTRMGKKVKRIFNAKKSYDNFVRNKSKCGAKYKLFREYKLITYLEDCVINKKWSPDVALGRAKLLDINFKVFVSAKTVYNYIQRNQLKITPFHLRFKLRRKKPKHLNVRIHKRKLGRSIEEREFKYERTEFGHWEADCICDKYNNAVLVLQERLTRYGIFFKLNKKDSINSFSKLKTLKNKLKKIIKTITCYNGAEFYKYPNIENKHTKVYFTHPYCSFEKGGVENLNGIIRRYIPSTQNLKELTRQKLQSINQHINNTPRKILNYKTPQEYFNNYIDSIA